MNPTVTVDGKSSGRVEALMALSSMGGREEAGCPSRRIPHGRWWEQI
ncbi:MAG: hypothetical protein HKL99_08080 [Burkholderiales bacterium]|nr:hypothetical protein [Burkholderiales bacterium]